VFFDERIAAGLELSPSYGREVTYFVPTHGDEAFVAAIGPLPGIVTGSDFPVAYVCLRFEAVGQILRSLLRLLLGIPDFVEGILVEVQFLAWVLALQLGAEAE
jgi:hypothetical protein